MNALFDEFKTSLDQYLDQAEKAPAEMYFLRYDSPLMFPRSEDATVEPALGWQEYLALMDDCQNYAISCELTSTYVFFDRDKFEGWLRVMNETDTPETRARWAAETQIKEEVITHVANPITYFIIVGHPDWYKVTPDKL